MNYLLDTHTLLWIFSDFENLPLAVQTILKDEKNTIFVSVVSVWEISIKKQLGKLEVPENFLEMIYKYRFRELEISFFHAKEVGNLPPIHSDPFDRLLIAQSRIENMPILTKDSIIPRYETEVIWEK